MFDDYLEREDKAMLKKTRILILAAVTMAVLLLGSTAVFADSVTKAPVQKTVKVAEGITIPNTTFTFTATQLTENPDGTKPPATVALTDVTISYNGQTSASTDLVKTANFDLTGITEPGEYVYKVTETEGSATGWTYNDGVDENNTPVKQYYMQVLVQSDGTRELHMTKGSSAADTTEANKVSTLAFENTYAKDTSLVISKAVENPTYEKDYEYEFTIQFVKSSTATSLPTSFTCAYQGGSQTATSVAVDTDGKATIKLKKNEKITISGIPAGTKYTVTETNANTTKLGVNYKSTKISQVVNGGDPTTINGAATEQQVIGENTNSAAFTNSFQAVSPTGIITHYLPYIAIILLAIGAFAFFVVSRRRRAVRY